jgi:DNA-binding transcriptional LysR family regulator
MNTRFLETFIWLAKLKSFRRTAEKLNSSQPAISGRLVALEESLGITLYERGAKPLELTPAGRRILRLCETIVDLTQELRVAALEGENISHPIRIGVSDIVMLTWMPDLLRTLRAEIPDLKLEITTNPSQVLKTELKDDMLDLAFIADRLDEPRFINAPLCTYRLGWLGNPSFFEWADQMDIPDLCKLPIIMPPRTTHNFQLQIEYLKRHDGDYGNEAQAFVAMDCGASPATGLEMVARGVGVMALPIILAKEHIQAGRLAILPVREEFPPWYMYCAYKTPPTAPLIPQVIKIAQAVAKRVAEDDKCNTIWP